MPLRCSSLSSSERIEGEKNHKKGGLNRVFKNFSSLRSKELFPGSESEIVQSLSEFRVLVQQINVRE